MIIEAREKFTPKDGNVWIDFTFKKGISDLSEIRTVEPDLNPRVPEAPYLSFQEHYSDPDKLLEVISSLSNILHLTLACWGKENRRGKRIDLENESKILRRSCSFMERLQ